jgi:hypothetical protein
MVKNFSSIWQKKASQYGKSVIFYEKIQGSNRGLGESQERVSGAGGTGICGAPEKGGFLRQIHRLHGLVSYAKSCANVRIGAVLEWVFRGRHIFRK